MNFFKNNRVLFLMVIGAWVVSILQACSLSSEGLAKQNTDPVGAYSGSAQVSSVLELSKTLQEIGVELPDGRVTSIKMNTATLFNLGQKVKVTRHKDGTGSVSL